MSDLCCPICKKKPAELEWWDDWDRVTFSENGEEITIPGWCDCEGDDDVNNNYWDITFKAIKMELT